MVISGDITTVRLSITGRVQGVFYRDTTLKPSKVSFSQAIADHAECLAAAAPSTDGMGHTLSDMTRHQKPNHNT